ncbi:MAG: phosphoribosylamine--glycine ligase, partial [Opitutales bacterium]
LGSGGREHMLAKVCNKSPLCKEVIVAPGNGGMQNEFDSFPVDAEDNAAVVELAQREAVDFVVVGPEVPLCHGVVDALNQEGILAYGPNAAGAQLEGSKAFTKDFLARHGIPTAAYGNFTKVEEALAFLSTSALPVVVKASGLAAGKGVIICQTREEAEEATREMLSGEAFGESGNEIVIEEFLNGEETSLHVIASGQGYVTLPMSQDHKKVGEGDLGLNTGGMGAYAPTPLVTDEMLASYKKNIVEPTLAGLKADGIDFRGTLYVGLMLTNEGPKVLEFNVRFGDPETQVILPMVNEDLVPILLASAKGDPMPRNLSCKDGAAMVVVLASKGYPTSYPKGEIIALPDKLPTGADLVHAGTQRNADGEIITSGGRVLGAVGTGNDLKEAAARAYALCDLVHFDSKYFRRDIGFREFARG